MQPYFFPYLTYYQLAYSVDKFIFFDDVNFRKKSFINRNYLVGDGEAARFTLPVVSASQNRTIKNHAYTGDFDEFKRLLERKYSEEKYYAETLSLIEDALVAGNNNVARTNASSIVVVLNHLGLPVEYVFSSDIAVKADLKGVARLREICLAVGAKTYVNSPGGVTLYSSEDFSIVGVDLEFISSRASGEAAKWPASIGNRSIIHSLMTLGMDAVRALIMDYQVE